MASFTIPDQLQCGFGHRFRVGKAHSTSVFTAFDISCGGDGRNGNKVLHNTRVVVKFKPKHAEHYQFDDLANAYNSLDGTPGIPLLHCSGDGPYGKYMALDELGPSLRDLLGLCGQEFSLKQFSLLPIKSFPG